MKILVLTHSLDIKCGIGRYSFKVTKSLKEKGMELKVLVAQKSQQQEIVERACLTDFFKKRYNLLILIKEVLTVRKELKEADLVHAFDGFPYAVLVYLANFGLNKKIFITGIGTYSVQPLHGGLKGWLLKKAYRKAEAIFCISSFVKTRILSFLPKLKNISVVLMGADFVRIVSASRELRKSPVIISVGALKRRKGQHLSIKALVKIKQKIPNIKLKLIGLKESQSYFDELLKIIKENNLSENVEFKSGLSDEDLKQEYNSADLFLMPSINMNDNLEGFGLVYLEANAFGLPCIGSKQSGAVDAILDGETGYLVEAGDTDDIADKVIKVLSDDKLYRKMSENSLSWIDKFSWDKTVESYIKAYELQI